MSGKCGYFAICKVSRFSPRKKVRDQEGESEKVMFIKKPSAIILMALTLVFALTMPVSAAVFTQFDSTAAGGHGWYNGTGGVDGAFTTLVADYGPSFGTLSLSLRLAQRYVGPISPTAENYYLCGPAMACNVEWSVGTTGTFHLSDFNFSATINDTTTGKSVTFDPSMFDNSFWGPSGKTMVSDLSHQTGFQNSEYLGFGFIKNPLGYVAGDTLLMSLSAVPKNTAHPDPTVSMFVNTSAVPEPATYAMMGLGLAGLGLVRRRRAS